MLRGRHRSVNLSQPSPLGTGAWRVVRISPAGLPVGRGRPLAAWAPRTRVRADAHKKIRGKMVKGIAIFGIRNFPTEWCGSEAARRAASISGGRDRESGFHARERRTDAGNEHRRTPRGTPQDAPHHTRPKKASDTLQVSGHLYTFVRNMFVCRRERKRATRARAHLPRCYRLPASHSCIGGTPP